MLHKAYSLRPTNLENQKYVYCCIEDELEAQVFIKRCSEDLYRRLSRKDKPTKEEKGEMSKLSTHISTLIHNIGGLRKNKKEMEELILRTILEGREKNVTVIESKYAC